MDTKTFPDMAADPESNTMKLAIAVSLLPTPEDRERFRDYFIGVLMNHISEELLSYCIGQAFQCWKELHPGYKGNGRVQ